MCIQTNHRHIWISLRCWSMLFSAPLMLSLLAGCDPCEFQNVCDDGNACNGVETCTPNDFGLADCGPGIPIVCEEGTTCVDPAGMCVADDLCANVECDTADLCNPEVCVDGECVDEPVICAEGEVCEPTTGDCIAPNTSTDPITTILQAIGAYSGAGTCGDDDDQVTFTLDAGILSLLGFTGNDTIELTIMDDLTATAENVTAFGVEGHDLTLRLDPVMGYIDTTLTLPDGSSCNTDLMLLPC